MYTFTFIFTLTLTFTFMFMFMFTLTFMFMFTFMFMLAVVFGPISQVLAKFILYITKYISSSKVRSALYFALTERK